MPYINLNPKVMERYLSGDSVYLGPTTEVNYRVATTRLNPYTGNVELTGWREEHSEAFPVLPGMFLSWIVMGILNFLTGRLFSFFGLKTNPLRLMFHYGYGLFDEQGAVNGYGRERTNGYPENNGNGRKHYINDNWEKDLERELYPLD